MILNDQQAAFLEGTRAADAEGRPLVLYHGTPYAFDRFERTKDLGFHFGTLEQARRRLLDITPKERKQTGAGVDRIIAVALRALNPLVIPDDPCSWNAPYLSDLLARFLTGADKRAVRSIMDARLPTSQADACRVIKDRLLAHGHDAILYRNQFESQGRSRSVEWSWLALRNDSILQLAVDKRIGGLRWPDDAPRPAGIDPLGIVTEIGGLRHRNAKLAKLADRRRFLDLAQRTVSGTIAGHMRPDFVGTHGDYTVDCEGIVQGRRVRVILFSQIGRMDVRIDAIEDRSIFHYSEAGKALLEGDTFKEDLEAALGEEWFGKGEVRPERLFMSRCWEPGERLEDAVASFDRDLAKILAALRPRPTLDAFRIS